MRVGIYELAKGLLLQGGLAATPLLAYLLAGAAGEFVGSLIRAPAEATKARLQSGLASSTGDALGQVPALRLAAAVSATARPRLCSLSPSLPLSSPSDRSCSRARAALAR